MIESYRKKRNFAFIYFGASFGIFLLVSSYIDPVTNEYAMIIFLLAYITCMYSYFAGFYYWAKGKGYTAIHGIGAAFFSFLGAIILSLCKDKNQK